MADQQSNPLRLLGFFESDPFIDDPRRKPWATWRRVDDGRQKAASGTARIDKGAGQAS